jgi:hypothetical protein
MAILRTAALVALLSATSCRPPPTTVPPPTTIEVIDNEAVVVGYALNVGAVVGGLVGAGAGRGAAIGSAAGAALGALVARMVDGLARGLVRPTDRVPSDFAYYSYLLFLDNTEVTQSTRYAAIHAFWCMLSDTSQVTASIERSHLEVLFLPVRADTDTQTLIRSKDPMDLLTAYDYDYALLVGRHLRLIRPRSGTPDAVLVGYPKAITPADEVNSDQLVIVSLQRSPADIEGIFRLYRQSLVLTGVQDVSTPWFANAFRTFLDQVGRMVTQTTGAPPANASVCR